MTFVKLVFALVFAAGFFYVVIRFVKWALWQQ